MRRTSLALLLLMPLQLLAADLIIAPGQTYTVDAEHRHMAVDTLRIGDAARIRFADNVPDWRLEAGQSSIGENVIIEGGGADGVDGRAGVAADDCQSQLDGQAGAHGSPGGDGVALHLQLGQLQRLGSLKIITRGGNGGSGGAGGAGADFDEGCDQEQAGRGGDGGNGAVGGKGGDISLLFAQADKGLDAAAVKKRIRVDNEGGEGGRGGAPGKGGDGGEGGYIKRKTLSGSRQWQAGVGGGADGSQGLSSESGDDGQRLIDVISRSLAAVAPKTESRADANAALQRELDALRRRVEQLELRLEILEK